MLERGRPGSVVATLFFVSFQLLGTFTLLNMVVAIILETFSKIGSPTQLSAASHSFLACLDEAHGKAMAGYDSYFLACLDEAQGKAV